jgi:hypothetical protein
VARQRSVGLVVKFFRRAAATEEIISMSKKTLWSLSSLARETGRNFRTVQKALADVTPDGKISGQPRWFMSSCIAALEEHERRTGRVQHRQVAADRFDPALEAQICEIEAAAEGVEKLLVQLRALPDAPVRRAVIEGGAGRVVGRYERALVSTVGDNAHSPLRRVYIDKMMSDLLGELCALCNWSPVLAQADIAEVARE